MFQLQLVLLLGVFVAIFARVSAGKTNQKGNGTDLCKDPTFDTMFGTPDGKTYIFKKDKYYELEGTSVADGPKPIADKWKGLPGD